MSNTARSVVEMAAKAAEAFASKAPAPYQAGLLVVAAVLEATAGAIQDHGKSVDEILRDIRMPPRGDTSFRDAIDERVRDLPEKSG